MIMINCPNIQAQVRIGPGLAAAGASGAFLALPLTGPVDHLDHLILLTIADIMIYHTYIAYLVDHLPNHIIN